MCVRLPRRCWRGTSSHLAPGIYTHAHDWEGGSCRKVDKLRRGTRGGQDRERGGGGDQHVPVVGSALRHGGGKGAGGNGSGGGGGRGDGQRGALPPVPRGAGQWQTVAPARGSKRRQGSPEHQGAGQQSRQLSAQQVARASWATAHDQAIEQEMVDQEEERQRAEEERQHAGEQRQQMRQQPPQQARQHTQPHPPHQRMAPPNPSYQQQPALLQQPAQGPPQCQPPPHAAAMAMYAQPAGVRTGATPYMGPPPPPGWQTVPVSNSYAALTPQGPDVAVGQSGRTAEPSRRLSEVPTPPRSRQPERQERRDEPVRERSRDERGGTASAEPGSTEFMRAQVGSGQGSHHQGAGVEEWP
jgi:hypothetical protein